MTKKLIAICGGTELEAGMAAFVRRLAALLEHLDVVLVISQQHQVRVASEFRAGDRLEARRRADTDRVQLLDVAQGFAAEMRSGDGPVARAALSANSRPVA